MDRERLFKHLEQRYSSKREMISYIPLGTQAETLWQELLSRRRAKSTVLPIYSCFGLPYWYVTTDKMVTASEKIVEALLENEMDYDPYTEAPAIATLEEVFYTSFLDGSQITMQDAMAFLESGAPPRDIEEQLILNNRQAAAFATANLYHAVDEEFLRDLVSILIDGLEVGTGEYRDEDWIVIHSMPDDQYTLPPARTLPDRTREMLALLEDPRTHPLIKAAVAQAWMLVIRPYPEGNERLGRYLSMIVLLRSGYGFLSDISLSALTAQKGYGYYEAIANILREENGGDLTYFIEYFLDLLARAVDERQLRLDRIAEENRAAEIDMARTPLIPSTDTPQEPAVLVEANPQIESFPEADLGEQDPIPAPGKGGDSSLSGPEIIKQQLLSFYSENKGSIVGKTALRMIEYVDRRQFVFTSGDLRDDYDINTNTLSDMLVMMKDAHIIEAIGKDGRFYVYKFCGTPIRRQEQLYKTITSGKQTDPGADQFKAAEMIVLNRDSSEDKVNLVKSSLMSFIANNGHTNYTQTANWLLTYLDRRKYRFKSSDLVTDFGLKGKQWFSISAVLRKAGLITPLGLDQRSYVFGFVIPETDSDELDGPLFSGEQALLGYESSAVTALDSAEFFREIPHNLTEADYSPEILELIQELKNSPSSQRDKRIGDFLLQCLPIGVVTEAIYAAHQYSSVWEEDMHLVEQMGIVERIDKTSYRILRELRPGLPRLNPSQKTQLTKMFAEFGSGSFSCEMVTATLDYSKAYICAILHQFTLIRVLKRTKTMAGIYIYQLCVNPDEHPECFVKAA